MALDIAGAAILKQRASPLYKVVRCFLKKSPNEGREDKEGMSGAFTRRKDRLRLLLWRDNNCLVCVSFADNLRITPCNY